MSEVIIFETQDGSHSIFSQEYGVSYHSKYGAIKESRHVFIEAGLFYKALSGKEISILEIGFGTGLNAYLSLLEAEKKGLQLHYTGVEAYPISLKAALELNYPTLLQSNNENQFIQMHEAEWDIAVRLTPNFDLTKLQRHFEELDFQESFDLVYFDAFAPNAQPTLWELPILTKVYKALRPEGVLVTYCAKGEVKRRLKSLGLTLETLQGPPGKREMIRCIKEQF